MSGVEELLVNLHLVAEFKDIGDVHLDGSVAEGFHVFVLLEFAIFGFVGVGDDDFINVGLGELFGFDDMLLRSTQQVIKEGDFQFEHLNELNEPSVGDAELTVKAERPWVTVGAVDGDEAVINVACAKTTLRMSRHMFGGKKSATATRVNWKSLTNA